MTANYKTTQRLIAAELKQTYGVKTVLNPVRCTKCRNLTLKLNRKSGWCFHCIATERKEQAKQRPGLPTIPAPVVELDQGKPAVGAKTWLEKFADAARSLIGGECEDG
jgi:hypothetical protein